MSSFKSLNVWKESIDLVTQIYLLTNMGSFHKDFGLKDQIRRASVSIPSNIAEGDELQTQKQGINFLFHAKGSAAEVLTQLIIAYNIGYIDRKMYLDLEGKCTKISSMLSNLIKHRSRTK